MKVFISCWIFGPGNSSVSLHVKSCILLQSDLSKTKPGYITYLYVAFQLFPILLNNALIFQM